MMKLARMSSHSWWWDSHNSPRQSQWLRMTIGELDEKTKHMLSLIETEADSFAQKVEIFYRKRPELINMIEEFYRAYRSLAEQYDTLKRDIRQNVPKAVQAQYGLSCESSQESPFMKQTKSDKIANQGFEKLKARIPDMIHGYIDHESCGYDSEVSEVDDPEIESKSPESRSSSDQDTMSTLSTDCEVDSPVKEAEEIESLKSKAREMEATISHLQQDKSKLSKQLTTKNIQCKHLQEEIQKLKKEKDFCIDEMSLVMQGRSDLKKELYNMKAETNKLKNENNFNLWERSLLQAELDVMKAEKEKLKNESEANAREKNVLQHELEATKVESIKLRNENQEIAQKLQVLTEKKRNLENDDKKVTKENKVLSILLGFVNGQGTSLKGEKSNVDKRLTQENLVEQQESRIEELQKEVLQLVEKNRLHEIELLDRNEEKREAIRQLCFTIEALSAKNQLLQEALKKCRGGESKRKKKVMVTTTNNNVVNNTQISGWKKFFLGLLDGGTRPLAL